MMTEKNKCINLYNILLFHVKAIAYKIVLQRQKLSLIITQVKEVFWKIDHLNFKLSKITIIKQNNYYEKNE